MRDIRHFLRSNPQAMILLIICLVLGLGTFIVVLFGIAGSGSHQVSGDPDGSSLGILHAALTAPHATLGSVFTTMHGAANALHSL